MSVDIKSDATIFPHMHQNYYKNKIKYSPNYVPVDNAIVIDSITDLSSINLNTLNWTDNDKVTYTKFLVLCIWSILESKIYLAFFKRV